MIIMQRFELQCPISCVFVKILLGELNICGAEKIPSQSVFWNDWLVVFPETLVDKYEK